MKNVLNVFLVIAFLIFCFIVGGALGFLGVFLFYKFIKKVYWEKQRKDTIKKRKFVNRNCLSC